MMPPIKEPLVNPAFKEERQKVVMMDVFPISDQETLVLNFESSASEWRQGVWMKSDLGLMRAISPGVRSSTAL